MNFTLNQLQIFLKIVETQSITKASQELHITQPAVSIQLRNLQDQFEIPLTEIIGRKIYITDFGKELAKTAENILNQVHSINYKSSSFKGLLTGKLKLSIVSTGKYVMPHFLSAFIKEHPNVDLYMDVTNKSKVIESLENNEVDFALVSILPSNLDIEKIDLLQNKLYLVGKNKLDINKHNSIEETFKKTPLIFREKGSGTRQTMERYLDNQQISILKKIELTSNEAVKQALLADLGYSIMPLIGIKNELFNKELVITPVKGLPIKTTWSLIWLKNKNLSPLAIQLLEHLKQHKSKIVKEKFSWYEEFGK